MVTVDASGAMRTGWLSQKENNTEIWYWLDEKTGAMASEKWMEIKGIWYYFGKDGRMVTGWQVINGRWELFDEDGAWKEAGDPV